MIIIVTKTLVNVWKVAILKLGVITTSLASQILIHCTINLFADFAMKIKIALKASPASDNGIVAFNANQPLIARVRRKFATTMTIFVSSAVKPNDARLAPFVSKVNVKPNWLWFKSVQCSLAKSAPTPTWSKSLTLIPVSPLSQVSSYWSKMIFCITLRRMC
jgi:hypothetical protein